MSTLGILATTGILAVTLTPPGLPEQEPPGVRGHNDTIATAQRISGHTAVRIDGTLSPAAQTTTAVAPALEDDGSITLATPTARPGITTTGMIGAGPHAATGDFDFYRIDAAAGDTVIVRVAPADTDLDPAVVLYDAHGIRIAAADQRVTAIDPVLVQPVTAAGTYYLMVAASGSVPADPFDAASGSGATSTGGYRLSIVSARADQDVYAMWLHKGEVLGAAVTGAPDRLTILDPAGVEVHSSTGDASALYPTASPLPRGPISADHVADRAGWHYIEVTGSAGSYQLTMAVHHPGLDHTGRVQTLYLDFDGARIDPGIFAASGLPAPVPLGPRDFAALSTFLPAWGLTAGDEGALEDKITATVRRNVAGAAINPRFRVRIRSSAHDGPKSGPDGPKPGHGGTEPAHDGPDLFGGRDVSRVVVGGSIAASGLPTIGIAQSVDPGNYATEETAVVLLDVLSRPAPDPDSLNTYAPVPIRRRIGYLGEVIGDYVSHEIGHLAGNWHTEPAGGRQGLMDSTDIAAIVAGPDGVGGTADDVHLAFTSGRLLSAEGPTGEENTAARLAFAFTS
jgi:hypothetical protein